MTLHVDPAAVGAAADRIDRAAAGLEDCGSGLDRVGDGAAGAAGELAGDLAPGLDAFTTSWGAVLDVVQERVRAASVAMDATVTATAAADQRAARAARGGGRNLVL